ncbi:MAG: PfkB family carbohydrate kinase [Bryobacteraceae bacterium]
MNIDGILAGIPALSVLVVGDVCLDRWCRYDPALADRSRETGIPRIAVTEVECTPGGAGTVASNLRALGAGRVAVLGVLGEDGHGHELRRALRERGIDGSALVTAAGVQTFTYTKLINRRSGVEDLARVDFVNACDLPETAQSAVVDRFRGLAGQVEIVIVSDQAELDRGGVVTAALRQAITEFADTHPRTVVWVDSRTRGEQFRRVLVKLNDEEARQACGRLGAASDYQALRRHIGYGTLMLTRGSEGCVVVTEGGQTVVPARRVEQPVDICGAGDSFNAGASLALSLMCDPVTAARFGNLVASITIMKPGTGTASPAEVRRQAGAECFPAG